MGHITLFLLLCTLGSSAQTVKPPEPSSIEGHVLNAATGEPVEKVALLLMRVNSAQASVDWTQSYAASSDSSGKFEISNVAPGDYRLRASRRGFVIVEHGARASRRSGTVLDLNHPRQLKDVDLRLIPHGVIAGRVRENDGEPLQNVHVQLLRSQYVNGQKVISTTSSAHTNDLGEYRWSGLAPGKYYIYAESLDESPPSSRPKEVYVGLYYPDAPSTASALLIDVAAGALVRTADMILRKGSTATVKGQVVIELPDTQGTPSVRFIPLVGHNNSSANSFRSLPAKVNAAGSFEMRGLTPGAYIVMAEIPKGGQGFVGRATVDVAGTNIENVVVTIGSGVSLTGRVRVDGEIPQDLQNASIRLRRGGPTVDSILLDRAYKIARDGTFKIENLDPNRYGVVLNGLPDGLYTKNIRVGNVDMMYTGVDLASGSPGQIDILVSQKAGLLSGIARNLATGQPSPDAIVVMLPKEKARLRIPTFYREATTDQHGRFTFKNVVPGEYEVYAWEEVEPSAWLDPDFMKSLGAKGASATVGEGAHAVVQVNLIPADSDNEKLK